MIQIRKALAEDCKFLAEIILLAESTGFEITSYEKMFGMTKAEMLPVFETMMNNSTDGHPLTYHSWLIATVDGNPVSAISAYVEGTQGDSVHLMTGALMMGFDRKKIASAFSILKEHADITIQKTKHTMQIDCVATLPEHRGKGLLKQLIAAAEQIARDAGVKELEIQVWKKNETAVKVYEKSGFTVTQQKLSPFDTENGKLLMTKKI